jgi:hypothetical protein
MYAFFFFKIIELTLLSKNVKSFRTALIQKRLKFNQVELESKSYMANKKKEAQLHNQCNAGLHLFIGQ